MDLAYLLSARIAPAQKKIFTYLGPLEFLALALTSKDVRASVQQAITSLAYNIGTNPLKFFKDPKAFRRLQASTGALIGGEFARKFFANKLSGQDELDIYACSRKNAEGKAECQPLIDYLLEDG
jgi:hypothetical protein